MTLKEFVVGNFVSERGIGLIMSTFGGNAFGMSDFRNFRVIDLELPKQIVSRFNGPNFGIEGMRKILETEKSRRPHLGTIVKPNVGLTPSEFQDIVYEAAAGGVDFVKDDELLVDPDYCPIEERAAAASEGTSSR
ncbi:hypothetical protein AKJ65_05290 [candidate division MSBL1 archaeon SCGC-AAA259E19]|uniref:Ribulose bisphosphate carboxylase large subunit C-terminal domain-containing protein n=1 Tax=candidate division MSBL1 archaeon SCGC-AAA259E19 TaxID=1698264 RepID=A0A133UJ14_9EURY|nr:hypothetical protein AKJ65_05290 [candidate division MSBL1 archaeon SCGC-AAA259E19]